MAHAEDPSVPPPPELTLAWQCQQYRALPHAGGVLDQPAGLLERMTVVQNVHTAWAAYQRDGLQAGEMVKWRKAHPTLATIVDYVKGLKNG